MFFALRTTLHLDASPFSCVRTQLFGLFHELKNQPELGMERKCYIEYFVRKAFTHEYEALNLNCIDARVNIMQ